jgi:hypothetical protein
MNCLRKTSIFKSASFHASFKHGMANENISSIDALPATINKALEQIERTTGMKAIILIGGPAPSAGGDFGIHW